MLGAFLAVVPSLTHAAAGFQAAPVSAGAGFRVADACLHPSQRKIRVSHPKGVKPEKPRHAMPHGLRPKGKNVWGVAIKQLIKQVFFIALPRPP